MPSRPLSLRTSPRRWPTKVTVDGGDALEHLVGADGVEGGELGGTGGWPPAADRSCGSPLAAPADPETAAIAVGRDVESALEGPPQGLGRAEAAPWGDDLEGVRRWSPAPVGPPRAGPAPRTGPGSPPPRRRRPGRSGARSWRPPRPAPATGGPRPGPTPPASCTARTADRSARGTHTGEANWVWPPGRWQEHHQPPGHGLGHHHRRGRPPPGPGPGRCQRSRRHWSSTCRPAGRWGRRRPEGGYSAASCSADAQWVVTRRPSSSPASAARKAPVHTRGHPSAPGCGGGDPGHQCGVGACRAGLVATGQHQGVDPLVGAGQMARLPRTSPLPATDRPAADRDQSDAVPGRAVGPRPPGWPRRRPRTARRRRATGRRGRPPPRRCASS